MKPSIKIVTLGCPKNIVDSEVLAKQISSNKFRIVFEDDKDAQIVIINTCGFINDAKQESIDTIVSYLEAKKEGRVKKVFVAGCLSQRYKKELAGELPEADGFFGTEAYTEILNTLRKDARQSVSTMERELITLPHYAYLKISEGCNQKCSFCAIPLIRGKHVSKPLVNIVEEAELLAEKGVKEIIVIAEDSTYYGLDIYGKQRIADLLENLSEVKGIEWIRLQYAFPNKFPTDLLRVIRENPKICKYIDIPFQHINDEIFKSMKRGVTKAGTLKLIDKIRKEVPGISLRTSLIVGYPLETEERFQELEDFVKDVRFERLGVFTYSHEEDTASYRLKDAVHSKEKKRRADRIMKLQQKISLENNKRKTGKIIKVIIDRKEGENFIGRTEADSPEIDNEVVIRGERHNSKDKRDNNLKSGEFYNVKITKAEAYDLFGDTEIISN